MNTLTRTAIPLLLGLVIALLPAPAGLAPQAWLYFAIFATVILALITEPLPAAGIGLIGVTVIAAHSGTKSGLTDRRMRSSGRSRVSRTARSG